MLSCIVLYGLLWYPVEPPSVNCQMRANGISRIYFKDEL